MKRKYVAWIITAVTLIVLLIVIGTRNESKSYVALSIVVRQDMQEGLLLPEPWEFELKDKEIATQLAGYFPAGVFSTVGRGSWDPSLHIMLQRQDGGIQKIINVSLPAKKYTISGKGGDWELSPEAEAFLVNLIKNN